VDSERQQPTSDGPETVTPEGVGATALMTAAARALETERAGGLLADPWARALAGSRGFEILDLGVFAHVAAGGPSLFVVRHRFFDDFLLELAAREGIRQVVLVAAGLDTRAFRLEWPPGTRVFEIDQPEVFAYKDAVLDGKGARPPAGRVVVPADLREDWPQVLLAAGFEPERPTAWVAEGLLFYLPEDAVHRLLEDMHRLSAHGSHLATDTMGATAGPPEEVKELFARLDAPFVFTTDDPVGLLNEHGWDAEAISFEEVGRRLGVTFPPLGRVTLARRAADER
jgi:methyltransferase (TIGR00027 family)